MISQQDKAKHLYLTLSACAVAREMGVSEATVRRWVKGVKKSKQNKYGSVVETIYSIAIRKEGINAREEKQIYMSHFGYEKDSETGEYKIGITDSQKSYIRSLVKDKAKASGNIALFVPEWVSLRSPRHSFNRMLQMTNDLYERMQEYISEYMVEFEMPREARYAVEQQLLVMLVPKYSPRNIYDVCSQAAEVVDQLELNMDDSPNKEKRIIPSKPRLSWTKENTEVYSKDLSDVAY
mgnify:CR=1 FL=1